MKNSETTSQTGAFETPLQVENVQYNINVGRVKSKVGLASTMSAIFGWGTTIMLTILLLAIKDIFLPETSDDVQQAKDMIVFAVAVLVPVLPLFIFAVKRLNRALREDLANADDVFFKKSTRFNLVFAVIITCLWTIVFVYNVLAKIILNNPEITSTMILNSLFFLLPVTGLTYFFWYYQDKTKR